MLIFILVGNKIVYNLFLCHLFLILTVQAKNNVFIINNVVNKNKKYMKHVLCNDNKQVLY